MKMASSFACVALGGALGASLRYSIAVLFMGIGSRFPYATLTANISGALIAGFVVTVLMGRAPAGSATQLLLVVGFLGSFTTMSAFSVDTMNLFQAGQSHAAVLNIALNLIGCLSAVYIGAIAARWWLS